MRHERNQDDTTLKVDSGASRMDDEDGPQIPSILSNGIDFAPTASTTATKAELANVPADSVSGQIVSYSADSVIVRCEDPKEAISMNAPVDILDTPLSLSSLASSSTSQNEGCVSRESSGAPHADQQEDRQGDVIEGRSHSDGGDGEKMLDSPALKISMVGHSQSSECTQTTVERGGRSARGNRGVISRIEVFPASTLGRLRGNGGLDQGLHIEQEAKAARGRALAQQGSTLTQQAMSTKDAALLDEGISVLLDALRCIPEKHPIVIPAISILGVARAEPLERFGNVDDLEQAIFLQSRALDLVLSGEVVTLDSPILLPVLLDDLGSAFEERFDRLGEMDDLEQAILLMSHSVKLTPDGHPDMPSLLNNLGSAFETRFGRLGEMGDLEQAISLMSRSAELTPDSRLNMPRLLNNLGNAFETRFDHLGEMGDLEQAILLKSRSVELTPNGHPDTPSRLNNLGSAFETRFDRLGEMGDLEQAISLMSRSVELTPNGHPDTPSLLNSLGNAFKAHFDRLGEMGDLEQAISLMSRSAELTPNGRPDMPRRLNNLGNAFETRFDRLGEMGDLEQAILLKSHSVELTPNGHPYMPSRLSNLGSTFGMRFDRLGEMGDLEQAILLMSRSVELTPNGHSDVPRLLNNLGNAFETRFDRLGEMGDLEQAISLKSRSVELTPNGHPDMPRRLSNLGIAFETRFGRLGEMGDLEQAILLKSHSVELTPDGHPDMPSHLSNLGIAFETRFDHLGEMSDLERTIELRHKAVSLLFLNHPDLPGYLTGLGRALQIHFTSTGHSGSCPEAVKCYEQAINSNTGFSRHRLKAVEYLVALYWSSETPGAIPSYDKLVSAYEHAFALIPEIVWLGSSIARRYALLADIREITSGAAAAAIAVGGFPRAVEWIEQGRGIVWNQLLQLRNPMYELAEHHPDLAQQLQHTSYELERSANARSETLESGYSKDDGIIREGETTRRVRLAQDYKELLSKIRGLEGFDDFLMPKKYAEVLQACESGPIVLINTFESSCDTLVCVSADRIIHVPLLDFHREIVQPILTRSSSMPTSGHRERAPWMYPADQAADTLDESRKRGAVLEADNQGELFLCSLWRYVVQPILKVIEAELHEHTDEILPHVTWCATGLLASLPLHAAGDYGTPGGEKAFNRVISSYVPTLSSLLRAHEPQLDLQSPSPKVLAISQSDTPGHGMLPGTADEVAKLKEHFPGDLTIHMSDSDATVDAVLQSMDENRCSYVHFACHGMQHPTDPTKSSFALHDGNLELGQLMSKSMDNASLAFLSACETATGDRKLTEESVHLAAGMLAVGFRGVIGTLWSICDDDAPLVADEFYRVLKERQAAAAQGIKGGSKVHAAYALHEATKRLREKVGESDIRRWAPFVHFGR